jgi:hypothetical protein
MMTVLIKKNKQQLRTNNFEPLSPPSDNSMAFQKQIDMDDDKLVAVVDNAAV